MNTPYKAAVQKLSPGAYAFATGAQIWIQSAEGLAISRAFAFRLNSRAEMCAWRDAFNKLELAEQEKLRGVK